MTDIQQHILEHAADLAEDIRDACCDYMDEMDVEPGDDSGSIVMLALVKCVVDAVGKNEDALDDFIGVLREVFQKVNAQ
jgi:hypothetical protein